MKAAVFLSCITHRQRSTGRKSKAYKTKNLFLIFLINVIGHTKWYAAKIWRSFETQSRQIWSPYLKKPKQTITFAEHPRIPKDVSMGIWWQRSPATGNTTPVTCHCGWLMVQWEISRVLRRIHENPAMPLHDTTHGLHSLWALSSAW